MWNNDIFWILIAPELVCCVCFAVEGYSESWRLAFEAIGRRGGKPW